MNRHRLTKWLAVPAALIVAAAVAVEVGTRSLSRRAGFELFRVARSAGEDLGLARDTREVLTRRATGFLVMGPSTARELDDLASKDPQEVVHRAAGYAWLSAGDGKRAARHWMLAARLAPDDDAAQQRAERGVNIAILFQARPLSRPAGLAAGAFLALAALGALGRRARARALRKYVDSLRADVRLLVDGESKRKPTIDETSQSATIDLFLKGRYGMCCPRMRRARPPIHVSFSNAAASRTVRLTPVRETGDAIRIHVRPDTLDLLREDPGLWRAHVRMNDRTLALAPVKVQPQPKKALLDRARDWLGA